MPIELLDGDQLTRLIPMVDWAYKSYFEKDLEEY
jgi:hypothetical protein